MTIQQVPVLQPQAPSAESLSDARRSIRAGGLLVHYDIERRAGGLYSLQHGGWTLFSPVTPSEFLQLLPAFDVVIADTPDLQTWLDAINVASPPAMRGH